MKKIVFLFVGIFAFTTLSAQEKAVVTEDANKAEKVVAKKQDENAPVFKFKKETIDYGTVEKGSDGTRVFSFMNTGKSPLIISSVKASCGCTVPSHPKEPIMPGATAEITVKYDTNKVAPFNKAITIFSNASEPKKVIFIKGNVKKVSALTLLERKEKSMLSNDKENN